MHSPCIRKMDNKRVTIVVALLLLNRRKTMNSLKDVQDTCKDCCEIFTCELCKQGHGIKQERSNVSKMIGCQIDHRKKRKSQCQN